MQSSGLPHLARCASSDPVVNLLSHPYSYLPGKPGPETQIIHLNIQPLRLSSEADFHWMAIRRENIHVERVWGEMSREQTSRSRNLMGADKICLLGFAHWSDGHGVCLHLGVQHPLRSLEEMQKKVKICNINNNDRQLCSTLCQVPS